MPNKLLKAWVLVPMLAVSKKNRPVAKKLSLSRLRKTRRRRIRPLVDLLVVVLMVVKLRLQMRGRPKHKLSPRQLVQRRVAGNTTRAPWLTT